MTPRKALARHGMASRLASLPMSPAQAFFRPNRLVPMVMAAQFLPMMIKLPKSSVHAVFMAWGAINMKISALA
jgi:hypothetical protein